MGEFLVRPAHSSVMQNVPIPEKVPTLSRKPSFTANRMRNTIFE